MRRCLPSLVVLALLAVAPVATADPIIYPEVLNGDWKTPASGSAGAQLDRQWYQNISDTALVTSWDDFVSVVDAATASAGALVANTSVRLPASAPSSNVHLMVIPEPGVFGMLLLGSAGLVAARHLQRA